ncbi:flagellin [Methanosarcina sp. MSH10X1]|uniref:flagellin n=1 Tax=Methanosarcina sp. MSH10X1 TaxID=2507075 RepID=UPI000FFBE8D6|nr:flagellin [Methanosarcina sp. MSH10X1]RXA20145.1 flagellin [Methanosarcina sp. MSH10X1]
MKRISSILKNGEIAFTALESAIVMTAFLVIAVVFSYVIIGAEHSTFNTVTTTNRDVEPEGPSIELVGSVIAKAGDNKVNNIILTLQLTKDQRPVNVGADSSRGMMIISYLDNATYVASTNWTRNFIGENDGDELLDPYERVEINISAPANSTLQSTEAVNSKFRLEVKPETGVITPVSSTIPARIDTVMNLKQASTS